VSAGIFNLFGLKKGDDAAEEPELIITIKRGILLTQVYISVFLRNNFTLAPANLRIHIVVATEIQKSELWLFDNDSGSPRAL
jgi:hypothetical protein